MELVNTDLNLLSVAGCNVGDGPAGLLLDALLRRGQELQQARQGTTVDYHLQKMRCSFKYLADI